MQSHGNSKAQNGSARAQFFRVHWKTQFCEKLDQMMEGVVCLILMYSQYIIVNVGKHFVTMTCHNVRNCVRHHLEPPAPVNPPERGRYVKILTPLLLCKASPVSTLRFLNA